MNAKEYVLGKLFPSFSELCYFHDSISLTLQNFPKLSGLLLHAYQIILYINSIDLNNHLYALSYFTTFTYDIILEPSLCLLIIKNDLLSVFK